MCTRAHTQNAHAYNACELIDGASPEVKHAYNSHAYNAHAYNAWEICCVAVCGLRGEQRKNFSTQSRPSLNIFEGAAK